LDENCSPKIFVKEIALSFLFYSLSHFLFVTARKYQCSLEPRAKTTLQKWSLFGCHFLFFVCHFSSLLHFFNTNFPRFIFVSFAARFALLQAVDEMDTRRRRILTSIDENVTASKATIGKAMKEVKSFGLTLRTDQSKLQVKAAIKPTLPQKCQKVVVPAPEMPKVASLSSYTSSSKSQSFVPVDCFDDEHKYLLYIERCRVLPPLFLQNKIISPKMRAILFDWMLQVQERFGLEHDTLHLAYCMVDRCLRQMNIQKEKLQLLGATCLFIAAKYEEVCIPHVNDFVYLAASSFTKRDIMVMERKIFQTVNFNMGFAYPNRFALLYLSALQNKDNIIYNTSKLFLDLFMSCYDLAHKLPSVMAQVSLYLSYFVAGVNLPAEIYPLMGIRRIELEKECSDFVDIIITFSTTPKETSLHRKYGKRNIQPRLSEAQLELLKTLKLH
jgi:hypothetical protein